MTTIDIDMLAAAIRATEKAVAKNMTECLYGDNPLLNRLAANVKPPTITQRLKAFCGRAKDAWLVLTGKLDPYDNW